MTELRKALERPVAGLVFDENRKNAVREKAFTAKRGGSALRRGAAAALVCTALPTSIHNLLLPFYSET